jgi:hypothetical protein
MTRGRTGVIVALAVSATIVAVLLVLAGSSGPGAADPLAECAVRLEVIADDGERLPARLYRCDAPRGRAPGLLVWLADGERTARWRNELAAWPRQGRTMLVLESAVRPGMLRVDLLAGLEALAAEPEVDAGRVAALLSNETGGGLVVEDGVAWPELLAAVVLADPAAPLAALTEGAAPDRVLGIETPPVRGRWRRLFGAGEPAAGAGEQVVPWLREQLAVPGGPGPR